MIRLHRGASPDCWTRENVKKWTGGWLNKNCESDRWYWPVVEGREINKHAVEAMEPWHHHKCAFCEAPLFSGREIEHFRSKTRHPLAAFVWRNLFLICRTCNQAKGDDEHKGCIKPDREDPEEYLWINPILLKIEPKPGISASYHRKAVETIGLYKLDRPELTSLYKYYRKLISEGFGESDERPFSLMIESVSNYQS